MKLKYDINDKPPVNRSITLALQQMLAILAATIAVPMMVGHGLTPAAAMFGAGAGTIIYQIMTKGKSPVFLGSSFSFLGSMTAAFSGGISMSLGLLGVIMGAAFAGLVYVILAAVGKCTAIYITDNADRVAALAVVGNEDVAAATVNE